MRRALVFALVTLLAVVGAAPAAADPPRRPGPADAPPPATTYRPPVEAPVSDPFRPPATRYGRGNRGLEFDTAAGDVVVAAAGGTVTFAGQVGGRLHVTVRHDDGIRTTYGPLARIAPGVARGAVLGAGEAVGVAGEHVLWTARLGSAYVDPAVLLAASGAPRVRLVADRPLGPG